MGKLYDILRHPGEIPALFQMWVAANRVKLLPSEPDRAFCYDMLNRVSRSFAIVIQQLPEELRDSICIFYLVLRALDTVEDDMKIPVKEKVPILRSFWEKISDPKFRYPCGDGAYVRLMDEYPLVTSVYNELPDGHRTVIEDITRRMGNGMADFIESEVDTVADWDQYCHYVAGLVGWGLSDLFVEAGFEEGFFTTEKGHKLSNDMGLFLQKTNIIRDYLEDIMEEPRPRMFWPKAVWSKYVDSLEDLKEEEHSEEAVECLNELINHALGHVPACLEYMAKLKDPKVFAFCAIPQIMAIGTLSLCYNNIKVFRGVVKMRRGQAAVIVTATRNMGDVYRAFASFAMDIQEKCQGLSAAKGSSVMGETARLCSDIVDRCEKGLQAFDGVSAPQIVQDEYVALPVRLALLFIFGGYFAYAWRIGGVREAIGMGGMQVHSMLDIIQRIISTILLGLFGYVAVTGERIGTAGE